MFLGDLLKADSYRVVFGAYYSDKRNTSVRGIFSEVSIMSTASNEYGVYQ